MAECIGGLLRDGNEVYELIRANRVIQRIGRGHGADQDEHDQAHPLLSVVGTMCEADAGTGADQERPDPEGRWIVAFRRLVERGVGDEAFHQPQQKGSAGETNQGRKKESFGDLDDNIPRPVAKPS